MEKLNFKGKATDKKAQSDFSPVRLVKDMEEDTQLYQRAGTITFFTLISRILGAIRDLVIAYVFGAGMVTDAFIQAFTIPNLLRRLTAEGSMTLAFVPVYTEVREKEGISQSRQFAQKTLGLVLWTTLFLTALGMIFSSQLVYFIATGFHGDPEKFQLTADLTRLMFPYLIFVSVVAWAMGVLNAEKHFAAPAAAPILLNLGFIGSAFFLSPYFDKPIVALGWGVLLGGLLQILLQTLVLRQCFDGSLLQSIRPRWPWNDPHIHRLLRLLAPALFGVAVYQVNIIILRNIASFLPLGQVTYYYNASRLTELVAGLFAFAFTSASFPNLSQYAARTDWDKTTETLRFSFAASMFFVVPSTVGLVIGAQPIIAMMYLRGAYNLSDVQQTIPTLQAFALGIPAVTAIRLLVSVFYACKETKIPVVAAALSLLVTGGLGWWWSRSLEVVGLALGLSAGTWFQCLLLVLFLGRRPEIRWHWLAWNNIWKYLFASALTGFFVWQLSRWGDWQTGSFSLKNWGVFSGLIAGAIILYFVVLLLLRESHALRWLHWAKRR